MNRVLWTVLLVAGSAWAEEPSALCRKRTPCEEKSSSDAGAGREVVELSLGPTSEDVVRECEQLEWWLTRPKAPPLLLLTACNDGYGASGVGEDSVEVGDNRFTHSRNGGSASRWNHTHVLRLEPLALVSETHGDHHILTQEASETSLDWTTFRLRNTWTPATCEAPEGGEAEKAEKADAEKQSFESLLIPQLALPADFETTGWKQTSLGRCAADTLEGWVVHGRADAPGDARLKALLTPGGHLFLEVDDDTWTGPSEKWLHDDHVELWLAEVAPRDVDTCTPPKSLPAEQRPVQWAIRIADGKVFAAHGSPKGPLPVELVRAKDRVRLKVQLPNGVKALTAVYSDSDSGKKQELLVATSRLAFANPATFSGVYGVQPQEATCREVKGALEPLPTPRPPPATGPVLEE